MEENFDIENDLPELKNILKAAIKLGCGDPKDLDTETFAYFDNYFIVSEKFSDNEIIASMNQKDPDTDSDTDVEEGCTALPSTRKVQTISSAVHLFYQSKSIITNQIFDSIAQLSKTPKIKFSIVSFGKNEFIGLDISKFRIKWL